MWTRAVVGIVVGASFASDVLRWARSAQPWWDSMAHGLSFKPSGRKCAGTKSRGQFDVDLGEGETQSIPSDGKAMPGCGHETRVAQVRAGKPRNGASNPTFRKTAECIVCPHCDGGEK